MDSRITNLMKALDITEAEAREIIAEDTEIDHGADPHPLSAEQKQAEKKARSTGTRKSTPRTVERKPDPDKRFLIQNLKELLEALQLQPSVTNIERQLDFSYHDRAFRIVLSAPRTT